MRVLGTDECKGGKKEKNVRVSGKKEKKPGLAWERTTPSRTGLYGRKKIWGVITREGTHGNIKRSYSEGHEKRI